MAFDRYILPSDEDPKLSVVTFTQLLREYVRGQVTAGEVKTQIEGALTADFGSEVTLDSGDISDLTTLVGLIDVEPTTATKLLKTIEIEDILSIAENRRFSLYNSRAKIRTRLFD